MPSSLQIQLHNQTDSSQVWAWITGRAIQYNMALMLITANGKGQYFPQSPSKILQPLTEDCAIPLGPPGNKVTVTIPQMAGARIWFSSESKLTFLLNPGPALVEPSVLNPSDPNAKCNFNFCEYTLNNDQLFANISYVDFVSRLPIALSLQTQTGAVQHVSGMPFDGLDRLSTALRAQAKKDGHPWDKLIVPGNDGKPLRALNPTHGDAVGASFAGYFEPLVDVVWAKFSQQSQNQAKLRINTQAAPGWVYGGIDRSDHLVVGGEAFHRPTTADILGCNSGPFQTGPSATRNAIIPRLAAAFQRGALVDVLEHPSPPGTFYKAERTNHYCRLVHEANLDGKGYAFAYDDVQPDGGVDQSGKVDAGDPKTFIVAVGGKLAYAGNMMP